MIVLGVDPGQHVGWVVMRSAPTFAILASGTVNASTSSDPDRADEMTFHRLQKLWADLAEQHPIELVALEQPVDAKPFWSSQKGLRREATGTAFRLGVYYGITRVALPAVLPVRSFPVHGYKGRKGWMPKGAKRENVLRYLAMMATASGHPLHTDHEHMALGVALHAAGIGPHR